MLAMFAGLLTLASCSSIMVSKLDKAKSPTTAKNVIFMIVDGMGFEHVKAARIYNGNQPLEFQSFACQSSVTTCSIAGADQEGHCVDGTEDVTDSAASATAMATGLKVGNGVISRGLPVQAKDVETILEHAKQRNQSTGIIATKLFTDATPAAFVSHADDRDLTEEILQDIFQDSRPNLIFGADTALHRSYAKKSKSKYTMVHNSADMAKLAQEIEQGPSCSGTSCPMVYGGFGQHSMIPGVYDHKSGLPLEITPTEKFAELGVPHLSQMTDSALKILSKNDKGFFLMVESSMPDMISHYNQQIDANPQSPKAIEVLIREMLEVQNTIKVIESFVAANPDTLVILTADHETGGLVIENDKTACLGKQSCVPTVRWTSKKYDDKASSPVEHTKANVPLYATGKGADKFCREKINNTDIPKIAMGK